ncbi:DUF1800 family protein [soil metagenome]
MPDMSGGGTGSVKPMSQPVRDARTALTRFGLGVEPGEIRSLAGDPRGYVAAQLGKGSPALPLRLGATPALLEAERAFAEEKKMARAGAANATDDSKTPNPAQQTYADELAARAAHATTTATPFVERLVMFWSNVMCVAAAKGPVVRILAGAFEREAIRPHVLGRFGDLLRAVTGHPAMLAYLDNDRSIGPNSPAGLRRDAGLNENLARETLELHSVGADGGYVQADVTNLARIITGWRTARPSEAGGADGFVFDPRAHEPGTFAVLGRAYGQPGVAQGEAVLADLATSPAAARMVARRLARHFVGDQAPAYLVAELERRFNDTGGDIGAMAAALVAHDAAWEARPARFLPPYDFLVAVHRLLGEPARAPVFRRVTNVLGQPLWDPPSPEGWPEDDAAWASPSGVLGRADWATQMAGAAAGTRDIGAMATDVLGADATPETLAAVARAESRQQALALLVTSSEFQTR